MTIRSDGAVEKAVIKAAERQSQQRMRFLSPPLQKVAIAIHTA